MATQTVTLPFASNPVHNAGANPDWVNPENARLDDNQYASVTWTAANQTSDQLDCLNLDTTNLPKYALPTRADVQLKGAKDGLVSNRSYFNNVQLRYNGLILGSADTTTNGDGINLSTAESDHLYSAGFGNPTLTRTIIDHATFGCRVFGHGRASTVAGDSLLLDQVVMPIVYDDRTPEGLTATVVCGGIKFTWNRGFLSNTVFDWRNGLMAGADPVGNTYLYNGFIEYHVQIASNVAFTGAKDHYIPSVSTARSYSLYTENGGAGDPTELCFLRIVRRTGLHVRHFRVRLIVRNTSTGAIEQASPWSSSVNATYDASADPEWVNRAYTPGSSRWDTIANKPVILFGELCGGSLSSGANQANYLRINMDTFNVSDSIPDYFRAQRDALRASVLAGYYRFGFFMRGPCGVNSLLTDATPGFEEGEEYFPYQGGTNTTYTQESDFNNNGLGTSPGILWPTWCRQYADDYTPGTDQDRLLSLTNDYESAQAGENEVRIHYFAPFAAAHMVIDNVGGEPTNDDILRAWNIPVVLDSGATPAYDVLFNAQQYNQFRGSGVENPETKLVNACQALGVTVFGERLGKTANPSYFRSLTRVGSVDALDLILDDATYSLDRDSTPTAGNEGRINLLPYLKGTETDLTQYRIIRVNTGTCAYVAAATGGTADEINQERMRRALIVAQDILYTWGGRAIPSVEPHTTTDNTAQADFDDFKAWVTSALPINVQPVNITPSKFNPRQRKHISTSDGPLIV